MEAQHNDQMEAVIQRHGDRLFRTALAILFDTMEAEDAVQDAFIKLLESYPAQSDDEKNIIEMVSALPVKYRTVIHLAHFEGYSIREIAVITNQKESAVRKQHTRARNMLRDVMKEALA